MSMANWLSILLISSKNKFLVLLTLAIVLFISFSLIYVLIFMIHFLLLTFGGFALPFLSALGVRLGCLFDVYLIS